MKYFIDTNIFLRVLERDDDRSFEECSRLLKLVDKSKVTAYTSNFVLSELVWVLDSYYDEPRSKIVESLGTVLRLRGLKVNDQINVLIALEYFNLKNVKYIDALIASNPDIQDKKMTVVSYDKDFDKLGVKRLEPKDLV